MELKLILSFLPISTILKLRYPF